MGRFNQCQVLLHRNASLPWFILVPDTTCTDLLDLPGDQLAAAMSECQKVASFVKQELRYPRLNYGAIGNLVPQMHLHVVGRSETDACWPAPVWGNLEPGPLYNIDTLREWQGLLEKGQGMRPATLTG